MYVCFVVIRFLQVNPLLCFLFYATPLVCTITNLVITRVSLHCTEWQLEPDSFVLRLATRCRVLAILKHRRSFPNIIGHYRKLHGTAVNVITEDSPDTCHFRNTKGNVLIPRNQFMNNGMFSFLGPTQIIFFFRM